MLPTASMTWSPDPVSLWCVDVPSESWIAFCDQEGTNNVTATHDELIQTCNSGTDLDRTGRDITAVDSVRIEVYIRDHLISPYYKAGLVSSVSLDVEEPHHRDLVLTFVRDDM